jgi:plasmid stabilization system protein ParE
VQVSYRPEVANDLQQARNWYNEKVSSLGEEFLDEFWTKMDSICENPESFSLYDNQIRSARLARFPYLIHYRYSADEDQVVVFAVMFGGRDVSAWLSRSE